MKEFYRILSLMIPIWTILHCVSAQTGEMKGKILDSGSNLPVAYATILNYSTRVSVYANGSGEFSIDAHPGDTLVFSSIGYFYEKTEVLGSFLGSDTPVLFRLSPQAYEITEARIVPLGTYDQFKRNFVNQNIPKSKSEMLTETLTKISKNEGQDAYNMALASGRLEPPRMGVKILSPEEMERIMLAGIIEKEKVRDQVYQKFNPEVVKKVTGLTDDGVIIEFMVFCDYPDQYLMEVNEYDLMVNIGMKYDEFKKKRLKDKSDTPVNQVFDRQNPNA
jgi:hypothetical protein